MDKVPMLFAHHQTGLAQKLQMLGNSGFGNIELSCKRTHATITSQKQTHDEHSVFIGKRLYHRYGIHVLTSIFN